MKFLLYSDNWYAVASFGGKSNYCVTHQQSSFYFQCCMYPDFLFGMLSYMRLISSVNYDSGFRGADSFVGFISFFKFCDRQMLYIIINQFTFICFVSIVFQLFHVRSIIIEVQCWLRRNGTHFLRSLTKVLFEEIVIQRTINHQLFRLRTLHIKISVILLNCFQEFVAPEGLHLYLQNMNSKSSKLLDDRAANKRAQSIYLRPKNRLNKSLEVKTRPKTLSPRPLHCSINSNKTSRAVTPMIHILKLEDQYLSTVSQKLYKPHKRIVRKLRRIYMNKQQGETELSTEENQKQELAEVKKEITVSADERQKRWVLMRKKQINQEDVDAVVDLYKQGLLDSEIQKNRELQDQVRQLKLKNSPMGQIIDKHSNLIEHYYMDMNVSMKQIIDFYGPSYGRPEDDLQSYETLAQEEIFKVQQTKIQPTCTFWSTRPVKSQPRRRNFFKMFNDFARNLKLTESEIKQNLLQAKKCQGNDFFKPVSEKFRREITTKNKLF